MMRNVRRLLVTLVVVVCLWPVGCARLRPTVREAPVIVLPRGGDDPAPFADAVRRRLAGVETFRARGLLRVERPDTPVRQANFLALAGADAQVRLRGTRAIGPTLFEVIADGERFTVTVPTRRTAYVGRWDGGEGNGGRPLSGTLYDPIRVRLPADAEFALVWEGDRAVLLSMRREGPGRVAQRIEFAPDTGHVHRTSTYDEDGVLRFVTTFEDYRALPALGPDDAFPHAVSIYQPDSGTRVSLTVREVVPNVPVPPGAFDTAPPAGYRIAPAAKFVPELLSGEG